MVDMQKFILIHCLELAEALPATANELSWLWLTLTPEAKDKLLKSVNANIEAHLIKFESLLLEIQKEQS